MSKHFLAPTALVLALITHAQQPVALTAKDYEHAESMLGYSAEQFVDRATVRPHWLPADKFWYKVLTAQGSEYVLVDPVKGTRTSASDLQKLGVEAPKSGEHGETAGAGRGSQINEVLSPDGKKAAFIRDYNLWVRNVATGAETQLTTDGVKDFGYATDNAGWKSSDRPILAWSADSRKIVTNQQDERNVGDMYLVTSNVGHPVLKAWKYPLPGDKEIAMIHRVIINVDTPGLVFLKIPADPHRATLSDDISSSGTLDDVQFNEDASGLAFISTSRDHKDEKFRIADAGTGAVREVFGETVPTQYESGRNAIDWRWLSHSNEIIWYSERDNWGHLYLYDAKTGQLKNQITKGEWVVSRIVRVDEKKRLIYFLAVGREGGNPYFNHLYKIGFDGRHLTPLTPEEGNHTITLSPGGGYFVDSYSQPDVAPVTVLRDLDGKVLLTLEKADISRLLATGWKAPGPITVKAADGKTDLYGLLFTPSHLDSTRKYPIIDYIYPGPQGGSVGNWSFTVSRVDNQALAELGFVVVAIEGTSNPYRSKAFHDMSYGDMSTNTLADQVAGIKELAGRYSYIDLSRIGIWGHSGGGFATAGAMFRYPDFFKVGISESGNHDNRNYEDDWGERYDGLLTMGTDGKSNYEAQANQNYAKNLKGKLMLAHGLMDDNVPPSNTMLVIDALTKANKDYDLVVFPNSPHAYGVYSPYMMRRRWDYFVRNLAGMEPPAGYELKPKSDPRNGGGETPRGKKP